ncbi:MAG TPA: NAD(P)H-dependent oxidoreductase [Candidatus Bathyarchaeia archaeon]|nr:NAD(P)H-dependent oxidoreductase [Candidatus Bathyarchaeia archaeon]
MNDIQNSIKILGIAGSLRRGSYNRAALRNAQKLVPKDAVLEIYELDKIPPFNQDLEKQPPESVINLKEKVRSADAILFVTPEYNYSIPGVLKNAIDWASRPYGDNAWDSKPVAVMGASAGMLGTARAQYHLRQVFVDLNVYPLNKPEVMIANAAERFDKDGNLTDQKTRGMIKELMDALVVWTIKYQKMNELAVNS